MAWHTGETAGAGADFPTHQLDFRPGVCSTCLKLDFLSEFLLRVYRMVACKKDKKGPAQTLKHQCC